MRIISLLPSFSLLLHHTLLSFDLQQFLPNYIQQLKSYITTVTNVRQYKLDVLWHNVLVLKNKDHLFYFLSANVSSAALQGQNKYRQRSFVHKMVNVFKFLILCVWCYSQNITIYCLQYQYIHLYIIVNPLSWFLYYITRLSPQPWCLSCFKHKYNK